MHYCRSKIGKGRGKSENHPPPQRTWGNRHILSRKGGFLGIICRYRDEDGCFNLVSVVNVNLPLVHPDDKVADELMSVGCPLLGREVEAADGVGELAATGRHLLLTQRSRITAGTLTAHVLQENSPVIPISIIKEVWWSGGQCPCL